MCFDIDSAPPVPAIAGASVSHELLTLRAADGNELAAFLATPDEPSRDRDRPPARRPRALPLLRGARASLRRAWPCCARDRLLRTHGRLVDARRRLRVRAARRPDDRRRRAGRHARSGRAPARARLQRRSSRVGFCFGGRASWVAAASGHGLAGSVGFYGSPTRQRGGPSAVERVDAIACPILALQAGDDQGITADDNATFERALTAAGVEHEIVVYDGAPHSFFDRKQEEFADASEDAWRRTLAFVDSHG